MTTGGGFRIIFSSVLFVLTGLVQTVSIQAVLYSGGGDRSTFLLAIPNYLGIVCVKFFGARAFRVLDNMGVWTSGGMESNRVHLAVYDYKVKSDTQLTFFGRLFHRDRRKLFILAFNELGGFLTGLTGLAIAGSGLYQVVFSGATVFTALLTTFFLRKQLSIAQWLSVALITVGLMITAEQVTHMPMDAAATSLISGLMFVLVSCLFYSTNYVIAEHLLDGQHVSDADDEGQTLPPPSGLDLSFYTGGSCLLLFSIYVLAHTVPNWHQLVTISIERHHGNTTLILEYYVYLAIASFAHAISHYDIVATVGAVPIGVLNALRAVSVFAASSWLFCSHQASQCYNTRKGISTAIVIGGALAYSAASALSPPHVARAAGYVKAARDDTERFGRRLRKAVSTYIGLSANSRSAPSPQIQQTTAAQAITLCGASSDGDGIAKATEGWSSSLKAHTEAGPSLSGNG